MASKKSPFQIIRSTFEAERLSSKFREALDEADPAAIREVSEQIGEIADAIEEAASAFDEIDYAEGREERSNARDAALEALDALVSALNQIEIEDDLRDEILSSGKIDGERL